MSLHSMSPLLKLLQLQIFEKVSYIVFLWDAYKANDIKSNHYQLTTWLLSIILGFKLCL